MFDEILVYCNSSRGVDAAVTTAIDLAQEVDAHLHFLYLAQQATDQYRATHSEEKINTNSDARDEVEALAERSGVEFVIHVESGNPKSVINEFAEKYQSDIIVIGAVDKNFSHIIRNSVAEEVVHSASMPVLTVQLDEEDLSDTDVYRCLNCDSGFQSTVDNIDYAQCPYCGAEKVRNETIG